MQIPILVVTIVMILLALDTVIAFSNFFKVRRNSKFIKENYKKIIKNTKKLFKDGK